MNTVLLQTKKLATAAFVVASASMFAQGTENLNSQPNTSGTSYQALNFTGADNTSWVFSGTRIINTSANYNIEGASAILPANETTTITFPNGIGKLDFQYRKAFTGANARTIQVSVGGTVLNTTAQFGAGSGANATVYNYSIPINKTGNTVVVVKVLGAQTTLDNFSWTAAPATSTTWDGTAWSNGEPTIDLDAVIAGDFSTSASLSVKSLTVNSGAKLTLNPGNTLNAINKITNNGTLEVMDGAFILQNSGDANVGNVIVHKNSGALKRNDFVFWSSPVTGSQTLQDFSPNTLPNRFYNFDEATNAWVSVPATTQFSAGKGFQFRAPNNMSDTVAASYQGVYNGTLNNGTYQFGVTANNMGFNLLGNPYPSTLNANLFFDGNIDIEKTAYFYMHSNQVVNGAYAGNNYATYTVGTGGVAADNSSIIPTENIAVGQGFMVKALRAANAIFTNGMRKNDAAVSYKNNARKDRLWLQLTDSEGRFSTMLVGFIEGATNAVDNGYDAEPFSTSGNAVFTTVGGKRLIVDGREKFNASAKVTLGLDVKKAGVYRISLSSKDGVFNEGQEVYITDRTTGQTADLNKGLEFNAESGVTSDRFEISFSKAFLGLGENKTESAFTVVNTGENVIVSAAKSLGRVALYDMNGRKIKGQDNTTSAKTVSIATQGFAKGVYVVTAEVNGKLETKKIIIK